MRRELAEAERRAGVRAAARQWRKAGLVDETTRSAVETRYSSDRVEKSPIWRALIFVFSCVILCSFFGLILATNRPSSTGGYTVLLGLFGIALAVATEFQQGPLRFDGTGGEAATSFLSLAFFAAASANALLSRSDSPSRITAVLLIGGVLFAWGWWRWGFPVYALVSAMLFFLAVSVIAPIPRLGWVVLAAVFAFAGGRLEDSPKLAPAHRTGLSLVLAAGLSGAYAALNLYSMDRGILEEMRPGASAARWTAPLARALAIAFTALFPLLVLAAGLRRRRRLVIDAGLAFAALSLATLRSYVHLGPLWLVLTGAGLGLVGLAFAAERFLARGPNRERGGLTAQPLLEDERSAQLAAAVAASTLLSPDARPREPAGDFSAGGGSFGGGGATGEL